MNKAALVLRGGVSRVSGRLLDPDKVSSSDSGYINFAACASLIQLNIIKANPEYKFDVFIQSWNPDLESRLTSLYSPRGVIFENNQDYAQLLHNLTQQSLGNEPRTFQQSFWRRVKPDSDKYKKTYGGLSQALAIKKGVELIGEYGNGVDYEHVILFRPDVALLAPMKLSDYSQPCIYVNKYANLMGDFHWVFHPREIRLFSKLLESVCDGNYHRQHLWIRDYFQRNCGERYIQDEILAGRDEEVMRQVKFSNISFELLSKYGVTASEYDSYDVIS